MRKHHSRIGTGGSREQEQPGKEGESAQSSGWSKRRGETTRQ